MGKATEKGLEEVSRAVLAPSFHQEGVASKKVCDVFVYRFWLTGCLGCMLQVTLARLGLSQQCDYPSRQRDAAASLMLLIRNSLLFVQQYATTM